MSSPADYPSLGPIPLRHHTWQPDGFDEDERAVAYGFHAYPRRDSDGVPGYSAEDDHGEDTLGDILGGAYWPPANRPGAGAASNRPPRRTGAHAFAWPAVGIHEREGAEPPGHSVVPGQGLGSRPAEVYPARDAGWDPDDSYAAKTVHPPPGVAAPAKGDAGIVLAASRTDAQDDLWLPFGGGPLVADHDTPGEYSREVVDVDAEGRTSEVRRAGLHTAEKVVYSPLRGEWMVARNHEDNNGRGPTHGAGLFAEEKGPAVRDAPLGAGETFVGQLPQGTFLGGGWSPGRQYADWGDGYYFGRALPDGPATVVGHVAAGPSKSGPIIADPSCSKHLIGETRKDGETFREQAGHISTRAYFKWPGDQDRDAPLAFYRGQFEPPLGRQPFPFEAALLYDPNSLHESPSGLSPGMWRLNYHLPMGLPHDRPRPPAPSPPWTGPPPGRPPGDPPPPPPPPPPGPPPGTGDPPGDDIPPAELERDEPEELPPIEDEEEDEPEVRRPPISGYPGVGAGLPVGTAGEGTREGAEDGWTPQTAGSAGTSRVPVEGVSRIESGRGERQRAGGWSAIQDRHDAVGGSGPSEFATEAAAPSFSVMPRPMIPEGGLDSRDGYFPDGHSAYRAPGTAGEWQRFSEGARGLHFQSFTAQDAGGNPVLNDRLADDPHARRVATRTSLYLTVPELDLYDEAGKARTDDRYSDGTFGLHPNVDLAFGIPQSDDDGASTGEVVDGYRIGIDDDGKLDVLPVDEDGAADFTKGLVLGEYEIPLSDGSADQALVTDGAGSVTWQDVAGETRLHDVLESDSAENATTTLADTGLDITGIKTGQWYAFKGVLRTHVINDSEGGGLVIDFDAGGGGSVQFVSYDAMLNHTDESSPDIKGKEIGALATDVEIWAFNAGQTESGKVIIEGVVQGPAEGTGQFGLRHALAQSSGGGGAAKLLKGSWIELREIEA